MPLGWRSCQSRGWQLKGGSINMCTAFLSHGILNQSMAPNVALGNSSIVSKKWNLFRWWRSTKILRGDRGWPGAYYISWQTVKKTMMKSINMLSTCPWWTICGLEDWTSRCQLFETWLVFLGRRPITDFLTSLPLAVLIESHLAIIDDLFRPPNVCIYCCIFRGRHVKFQNDSLKESPVHIPKPFRSSCKIPKRRR